MAHRFLSKPARSFAVPVLTVALALTATACSGGDSPAADIAAARGRLSDNGIACNAKAKPYEEGPRAVDLGVKPTSTIECLVDGVEIQLTQYGSETDRRKAMGVSKSYLCSFGGTGFSYATAAGWIATAQRPETNVTDTALLSKIAEATDGDIEKIVCPKGSDAVTPPGAGDVQVPGAPTTVQHGGH